MNELELLMKSVGTWDVELQLRAPGQPVQQSRGVCVNRSISAGAWLVSEMKNETTGFEGHGVYGFDPTKRRFVGTWVDNARRVLAVGEGTWDEAKRTMTYVTKLEVGGRTMSWRDVTEVLDEDTQLFHNFVQLPDGSELEVVTAKYVRRKV